MDIEAELRRIEASAVTRDDVEFVVKAFASRYGIDGLQLDEQGRTAIQTQDGYVVTLTYLPDRQGIIAALAMPEELGTRPDLLRELLEANLSFRQNTGGTFGKMPEGKQVIYCKVIPVTGQDAAAFEQDLRRFFEVATGWLQDIELALDLDPEDDSDEVGDRAQELAETEFDPFDRV
ncbi:MAG: type III secretion system chaperone [Pseudomonadota bacterium]